MTRSRATLMLVLALLAALLVAAPAGRAEANANLTVEVVGNGTVQVTPDPPYTDGQQVTLTAVPDAGWKLSSWTTGQDDSWHDAERDFRVPVTVAANGFDRLNKPVDVEINFQSILNTVGGGGTFNPASVRVVEVDQNGALVDGELPFQFAVKKTLNMNYNGSGLCATDVPGQGTVTFIMEGNTAAGVTRTYQVYFDKTGKTITPVSVPPQITVTDGIQDEGQTSIRVQTPTGTYFYHKLGAGFSSFNDVDGNDWIGYSLEPEAAGKFRGIPNSVHPTNGGDMHPGDTDSDSCVLNAGPIKATVYSNRLQTQTRWNHTWDFYPGYVRHTLNEARFDHYWLYEGTPGGELEVDKDFVVYSDGVQIMASETRESDIPGDEWGFVADPNVGRSIFLIKEEGDSFVDSYRDLTDLMTVFAFGRNLASKEFLPKAAVPAHYIFGLMDTTTIGPATTIINNAFKPLAVTAAAGEKRSGANLGSATTIEVTLSGDTTITATFVKEQYTLTLTPVGSGTINKAPDKATYEYGEVVTITAVPGSGLTFTGWSGDLTGTTNPTQVTMTGNKSISATFAAGYTVTTSVNGEGEVNLEPAGPIFLSGTVITATAVPDPGWEFTGWSGSLISADNPEVFAIGGNMNITANFEQGVYTLDLNAGPNGTVDWLPKKDTYLGGEVVTIAAVPNSGFAFAGWTGDLVSAKATETVTMTKDTVITGTFKTAVFYPLTVTVNGNGTVNRTPNTNPVLEGTMVTLDPVAATNWAFTGWSGDLIGTTTPGEILMDGPKAVTANFQQTAFSVDVTTVGAGTVSRQPSKNGYDLGEVVTLTANAGSGWTFAGWSGTETGTTNPLAITISGDEVITATFSGPILLTTATQGSGEVQVSPDKPFYSPGESVILTAVPDDGWVFAGWTGDLTTTQNPAQIVMNKSKSITAVFIEPGLMVSDDFDRCALGVDPWTFINPLSDSTATVNGTRLQMVVPATADHNIWKDNMNAPRLMQRANDTSFEFRARFLSPVSQPSQSQGLLFEQDATKLLRVDFSAVPSGDKIFAYGIDPLLANPKKLLEFDIADANVLELSVSRNANNDRFTVRYRLDDAEEWITAGVFAFDMQVNKVGLFAANVKPKNGVTPPHTALVDYFYNAADGVEPADTPLLNVLTAGQGTVQRNPAGPNYTCGTKVTLTPKPAFGWGFDFWSGAVSGIDFPVVVTVNGPTTVTANFTEVPLQKSFVPLSIR